MKKTEPEGLMSFFEPPISRTKPTKSVDIYFIYQMIVSGVLRLSTEMVRAGKALKSLALPFFTPAGIFFPNRNKSAQSIFSGNLGVDIDDCPVHRKSELAADTFLNPMIIHITSSGNGLRLIIKIRDSVPEQFSLYYQTISRYLKGAYGIEVDPSCKNINRCHWLAHDEDCFFNPEGSVSAVALLKLLTKEEDNNPAPVQTRQCLVSTAKKSAEPDPVADRLNDLPEVLQRAFSDLYQAGWRRIRNTDYWDRPGGRPGRISGVFNRFEAENNRWVFTNWSKNGTPFETRGYSPLGVVAELEFSGDFGACVTALAEQYPDPGRTAFVKLK